MNKYEIRINIKITEDGSVDGELVIPEEVLQAQEGTPLAYLRDDLLKICAESNPVPSIESYLQSVKKLNKELDAAIDEFSI